MKKSTKTNNDDDLLRVKKRVTVIHDSISSSEMTSGAKREAGAVGGSSITEKRRLVPQFNNLQLKWSSRGQFVRLPIFFKTHIILYLQSGW